jgi:hypothetical protein
MKRRLTLLLGLVMALSLVSVSAVSAHGGPKHHDRPSLPATIDLPAGFQPEGIASNASGKLFVGSLVDGAIWKGSARTGLGSILVPGVAGQTAFGLHLDWLGRLWVAGGANKTIRVYNSHTGELLKEYAFSTAAFINDLVITREAVYATDSTNQQLLVMPIGRHGRLLEASKATFTPLTGDIVYGAGFNANGIVAKDGWLVIDQSNTGLLFRVNPRTGNTKTIDTHGYNVANGDGLLLRGHTLFVIRNFDNKVSILQLGRHLLQARELHEVTSSTFDTPTGGTFALGRLWIVNARFTTTPTPTTPYWITRLP